MKPSPIKPPNELSSSELYRLTERIKRCRICCETPLQKTPLPHDASPVLYVSETAKIALAGQAPGKRVHDTAIPFNDSSGDRLRAWLDLPKEIFYDTTKIAIIPMGFCFPGYSSSGADLPPRRECKTYWHNALFKQLKNIKLLLAIGSYAQNYHIIFGKKENLTENIKHWEEIFSFIQPRGYRVLPLPHPSWRNNRWLKKHPWFEEKALPHIKSILKDYLQ